MSERYDLVVIGGGSGGVRAARIAATHGAKVAICEEYRWGGTCVIRGCVPKKLFVYASHVEEMIEDAAGFGWQVETPRFDWPTLIANKDREIARLEAIYERNLKAAGVTVIRSRGEIEAPHRVRLVHEDRAIEAETILIATGGRPNLDASLPGIEHVITSNEVFHLETMPKRVVVAGGGYIAVEFAGIFAGLGADTTLLYRGPMIMRGFDDDLRSALQDEMRAKGINLVLNDTFERIDQTPSGLVGTTRAGLALEADQILFAIGRNPAIHGLGLDKVGVELTQAGAIKVDAFSKTSVDHIYAVGDVTDRVALTPVAIREGHAFADTLYGGKTIAVDHALIPTAVFSQPEIGTVGLSEADALKDHPDLDIYLSRFRPMKLSLSGREEKTLMKIIVDAASDKVLGVHVLGPDSGEMAQLLGIALKMGATKADFDATVAVHPTAAEELVTMRTPSRRLRGGKIVS
ncbi:MAG: glutathione-disulfide reductase [Hyphomicrobiaceae bacterium]|nr:glutathione-disulfide reductase [Hyphomicrobiaceae bacterium]